LAIERERDKGRMIYNERKKKVSKYKRESDRDKEKDSLEREKRER
jgi:hypothetical protein